MICKIENLNCFYGKTHALCDVSTELDKGVYGILGENGAGKTTLLKSLCGLIKYKGSITYGCDKQHIGYLPQNFFAFDNLSLIDNIKYFASYKKDYTKNISDDEIYSLLKKVGLEDKATAKAGELSGGMRRRLGLAQALLGDVKLLILDEPTSGLDPEERIRFREIIEGICKDKCVVITTHIIQDVENLCDRLIVLHKGKMVYDSDLPDIKKHAENNVYCVPRTVVERERLEGQVVQFYNTNEPMARVISYKALDFEPVEPTVEDGYLCLIKGLEKE